MSTVRLPKLLLLILLILAVAGIIVPFILPSRDRHTDMQHIQSTATARPAPMISNQPNVPATGSLKFGMYTNSLTPTSSEQAIGHKLNIIGQFIHFNQNLGNDKLAYACQHGYVPLITWESWNGPSAKAPAPGGPKPTDNDFSLSRIASGKLDDLLKGNLKSLATACKQQTVIIRFDHEMDGASNGIKYYTWQGDPATYIAAWRHVVALGRSVDPHIKWLWSPNRANSRSPAYYPGNEWVDYVGLTLNRNGAVIKQPNAPMSFADFYKQNSAIESYRKPVLIAETTTTETATDPTFKARWIRGMFAYAQTNRHIVGLVWFNNHDTNSYNSSPAALKAFQDNLL